MFKNVKSLSTMSTLIVSTLLISLLISLWFPVSPTVYAKGKPQPPEENMGILFFDGFERGTHTTQIHPWETGLADGATVRTGARSTTFSNTVTKMFDYSRISDRTSADPRFNESDVYISCYLYFDVLPTAEGTLITVVSINDATKCRIMFNSDTDTLRVRDSASTILDTGTTEILTDEWYRIDFYVGTGASGNYEVRINNNLELSGTGNLTTDNTGSIEFRDGITGQISMDDVVMRDDMFHAAIDDYRVETLLPDGDGNYTDWTGSYLDVDEVLSTAKHAVASRTFIETSTDTNRHTVTLDNIGVLELGETVDAVMIQAVVWKDVNSAVNCQIIDRSGTTDRDTVDFLLEKNNSVLTEAQDVLWWEIYETKPGGGAFSETNINAWEIGLEHNQSQSRAIFGCTLNANVLITTPQPFNIEAGQLGVYRPRRNPLLRQ